MKEITKKIRLQWSKEWQNVDPMKICHSDESSYEIGYDSRGYYITQAPHEDMLERNLKPSFKSGRKSVSAWACFCGRELGPIKILEHGLKMTARQYLDEIIKPLFVPFWRKMQRKYGRRNFPVYMQQDNHPVHNAKLIKKYLARMKVKVLPWPPTSPDLAPIENLWKQVKVIISGTRHRIRTKEEIGEAIVKAWPKIAPDRVEKLAMSLPKRMDLCIQAKGGPIRY
jgi:transposase